MEPLKTNRKVMIWLCMCPAEASSSKWNKIAYKAHVALQLIFYFCGVIATLAFALKFVQTDLEKSILAIFSTAGFISSSYVIISGITLRHKIEGIFKHLSTIYKTSKYSFQINKIPSLSKFPSK